MVERRRLTEALATLVGERFSGIGQAAGMGVLEFGDLVNDSGEQAESEGQGARYALHVQCAFRVVRNGVVVLGSRDQRWSRSKGGDFLSMYDLRAVAIDRALAVAPYLMVTDVTVADVGDLHLRLSGSVEINVFIDSSTPSEQWRFVRRYGDHVTFPISAA